MKAVAWRGRPPRSLRRGPQHSGEPPVCIECTRHFGGEEVSACRLQACAVAGCGVLSSPLSPEGRRDSVGVGSSDWVGLALSLWQDAVNGCRISLDRSAPAFRVQSSEGKNGAEAE